MVDGLQANKPAQQPSMVKRWFAWAIFSMLAIASQSAYAHVGSWPNFKQQFIKSDATYNGKQGLRVIDSHQQLTHSEGQGYGMLLAYHYGDLQSFHRLWLWTQSKLQVRDDQLLAWSYGPKANGTEALLDKNNATDGDILVAYALLLASDKWSVPDYKAYALAILDDVLDKLVMDVAGEPILMPGIEGFLEQSNAQQLRWNPSYQITSAYQLFAEKHNKRWGKIAATADKYLQLAAHTPLGLPADWVSIDLANGQLASEGDFAYEAIRVLLYQTWIATPTVEFNLKAMNSYFRVNQQLPAKIKVNSAMVTTSQQNELALAGFYQIYAAYLAKINQAPEQKQAYQALAYKKLLEQSDNYYAYVLYLLAGFGK
jgi:endoglucanase